MAHSGAAAARSMRVVSSRASGWPVCASACSTRSSAPPDCARQAPATRASVSRAAAGSASHTAMRRSVSALPSPPATPAPSLGTGWLAIRSRCATSRANSASSARIAAASAAAHAPPRAIAPPCALAAATARCRAPASHNLATSARCGAVTPTLGSTAYAPLSCRQRTTLPSTPCSAKTTSRTRSSSGVS